MHIAILRHGPTEWNERGRIQGHTDVPLSAAGLARMQCLCVPAPFHEARFFVSPQTRARQTAEALGLIDPIIDARLMEQNWGRWEGFGSAEILAQDGPEAFTAAGLHDAFRPPGGESTAELHGRIGSFLKDVAGGEGDALAVAHLGVLRAAYTLATGWDMATPMPKDLDVSKILILSLTPNGTPSVARLNVDLLPRPQARPISKPKTV